MGIGSLSKYRRFFMIGGFVLFAGGALLRWHHKRQMESLKASPQLAAPGTEITWVDDCETYACRVVGLRGAECKDMCQRAAGEGNPRVQSERIANACKKQCVADETPTAQCRASCLISEARKLTK